MSASLADFHQILQVGRHGIFFSEIQTQVLNTWINRQVFPDAAGTIRDPNRPPLQFHRYTQLDAQPPFAEYYDPATPHAPAVHADAHLLASLSLDPPTVLWGYADMFADRRDLSPVPHRVFSFGRHYGLEVFNNQAFYYADEDSDWPIKEAARVDAVRYLGGVAAEILGPGYLPQWLSTSETSGFVVLTSNFTPAPPAISFDDVFNALPDLLSTGIIRGYDLHTAMHGLARHLSWRIANPEPGVWQLAPDPASEYIDVRCHGGSGQVRRLPLG